jgi:predicted alpha/beta-fold hydrolase
MSAIPSVTFGPDPPLAIQEAMENVEVLKAPVPVTTVVALDYHGQMQTVVACFTRSLIPNPVIVHSREVIELADGGHVALDWLSLSPAPAEAEENADANKPVLIMCHGLCGSSDSDYIVHTAQQFLLRGFRVGVFIARGCAGLPLNTPVGFSGARTEDLATAVELVCGRHPAAKLFCVGYSLGAGILMNYVGNHRELPPQLTATCCVCPPWDMRHANPTPVFPVWSFVLSLALKGYIWANRAVLAAPTNPVVDLWAVLLAPSVRDIDRQIVQLHGFPDVEAYYHSMSSAYVAKHVTVPTLAISAEDDPCCTIEGCPDINRHVSRHHAHAHRHPSETKGKAEEESISCSDNLGSGLVVVRTAVGGHLGFMESLLDPRADWTDRVAIQWFNQFR